MPAGGDYELWKDEPQGCFKKTDYSDIYPDYVPMKPDAEKDRSGSASCGLEGCILLERYDAGGTDREGQHQHVHASQLRAG